jgi:hypothetical protein
VVSCVGLTAQRLQALLELGLQSEKRELMSKEPCALVSRACFALLCTCNPADMLNCIALSLQVLVAASDKEATELYASNKSPSAEAGRPKARAIVITTKQGRSPRVKIDRPTRRSRGSPEPQFRGHSPPGRPQFRSPSPQQRDGERASRCSPPQRAIRQGIASPGSRSSLDRSGASPCRSCGASPASPGSTAAAAAAVPPPVPAVAQQPAGEQGGHADHGSGALQEGSASEGS